MSLRIPIMSAKLLALERDTESSSSGSFGSGLQLSGAEQSSATEGSSGLSSSASSSVMSLITKDVVDWKEGPKQCTGEEALELPGDNRSGVSWAEAAGGNERGDGEPTANHVGHQNINLYQNLNTAPELPPEPTSHWRTAPRGLEDRAELSPSTNSDPT